MDEAIAVSGYVKEHGVGSIIVVTSKYHTRRAQLAFKGLMPHGVTVTVIGARFDSYDPWRWWSNSDTRKHVLHEYGGLLFYTVKLILLKSA